MYRCGKFMRYGHTYVAAGERGATAAGHEGPSRAWYEWLDHECGEARGGGVHIACIASGSTPEDPCPLPQLSGPERLPPIPEDRYDLDTTWCSVSWRHPRGGAGQPVQDCKCRCHRAVTVVGGAAVPVTPVAFTLSPLSSSTPM